MRGGVGEVEAVHRLRPTRMLLDAELLRWGNHSHRLLLLELGVPVRRLKRRG